MNTAQADGQTALQADARAAFERRYEETLEAGYRVNPRPPPPPVGTGGKKRGRRRNPRR